MRRLLVLVVATAAAVVPGCACRATPIPPTDPTVAIATPSASASGAIAEAPAGLPFDANGLAPVLADPRAAEAAKLEATKDDAGAARALEAAAVTIVESDPVRFRFSYAAARLHSLAKEGDLAFKGFLALKDAASPLAGYARFHAAEEAIRAGRLDEGKDLASSVPEDMPIAPLAKLLIAEVLEKKGDNAGALTILQAHLATGTATKKPTQWATVSVRAARVLIAMNAPDRAEEALHLARTVALSMPRGPVAEQANDLVQRALAIIPSPRKEQVAPMTHDEEVTMLTALADIDSAAADKAVRDLDGRFTEAEKKAEVGCRAATLTAQIKVKRRHRGEAADAWGVAIDRCEGDAKVFAAFQGGKASRSAGRPVDAMARYEQVETLGPKSRYADDARVQGADAARIAGDEARFSSKLERIADDYPDGDMTTDGLFRLAFFRIERDDWAGAVAPLERADKIQPKERAYWAAGRTPYFLARARLALGDREHAIEGFRKVVQDYPYTYYMLVAHARLAELDSEAAAKALAAARTADAPFAIADDPALHGAAFARVVELLAVGEIDSAKAEVLGLGLAQPDAKEALLWTLSQLYAKAGDFRDALAVPRGRITDWLDHYPEGAWHRAWELAYPRPYLDIVSKSAKSAGISPSFAYAIMREESSFDAQVVSPAKAYGLMQLILPTAKTLAKRAGVPVSEALLKTPETNVPLGCRYLGMLRDTFSSCPILAIPAYNAGAGAPKKWLDQRPDDELDRFVERIPYEETRNYTKRVLGSYAAYLALYEPDGLGEVLRLPKKPQGKPTVLPPPPPADDAAEAADVPTNDVTKDREDAPP